VPANTIFAPHMSSNLVGNSLAQTDLGAWVPAANLQAKLRISPEFAEISVLSYPSKVVIWPGAFCVVMCTTSS
jgi:hypothetical protein